MSPELRNPPWRVLLVGCGQIAGGFDDGRPADAWPLTHAGAMQRHGGFQLAACVEPDDSKRAAFMKRWGIPIGVSHIDELSPLGHSRFDVISICSPTAAHGDDLQASLRLDPALVFCEKPVTPTVEQTARWVDACDQARVLLAVNHTRRWAPDVIRLRDELHNGTWGDIRSAVGHYNKGVLNNGGHLVDLLHLLLGPMELVHAGEPIWDHWPDDPSIPAMLRSASGVPVYLDATNAADFALFELQITTSNAVITMEVGGQSWRIRQAAQSPSFRAYKALGEDRQQPGEYALAMSRAVENIHAALLHQAPLASTGRSALEAQRLCERIRIASNSTERRT